jgi:methionine-rich copper-binding protein CopC
MRDFPMWHGFTSCTIKFWIDHKRTLGARIKHNPHRYIPPVFFTFLMHVTLVQAYAMTTSEMKSAPTAQLLQTNKTAVELYAPKQPHADRKELEILLAHAIIVRTSPPQGGVAPANIGKVDVWYDAGIRDSLAALAVVTSAGERVDKRDAAIDSADPAHVSVSVNPMVPGKYTVRYRALSADGHMVSGAWEFDVQP